MISNATWLVALALVACGGRTENDPGDASAGDVAAPHVDASAGDAALPGEDGSSSSCDCEPIPPSGASYVLYDETGRADCPSGTNARDVVEGMFSASTCACSCDSTPTGTPDFGPTAVSIGVGNSCSGNNYFTTTGDCTAGSMDYDAGAPFKIETYVYAARKGVGCTLHKADVPPTYSQTDTRLCSLGTDAVGGCHAGQQCVPKAPPGFVRCLAWKGPVPTFCPSAFSSMRSVGSSAWHSTACNANGCYCSIDSDWHEQVHTFTDDACTTAGPTLDATGLCNTGTLSSLSFQSFTVTSSFTGTCKLVSPPIETDNIDYANQTGLCCAE
jgi:hypothetical protein